MTMSATYAKLRSGEWGIKSTIALRAGDTAVVVKRSGQARRVIVGRVLWTGNDGACLATIAMSVQATKRAPAAPRMVSDDPAMCRAAATFRPEDYETDDERMAPANDDGRFADEWEGVGS
jgi:hypothetical protein